MNREIFFLLMILSVITAPFSPYSISASEGLEQIRIISLIVTKEDALSIAMHYANVKKERVMLVDFMPHDLFGDGKIHFDWAVIENLGLVPAALQATWINSETGEIIEQIEPYLWIIQHINEIRENAKNTLARSKNEDDCGE